MSSKADPIDLASTEAPVTLLEEPPRALGLWDQVTLWGNLGITLTIPVAAAFVLRPVAELPPLTLGAAVTAILVGSVLGSILLALSAVPGADTGAPAMVLLRGLLGRRGSWAPTALNVAQCIGWAAVEILVIAEGAAKIFPGSPRAAFVVAAGAAATALALYPLGFVRTLRRYAVWLVLAATAYLFVEVARHGLAAPRRTGSWQQFWLAVDVVVAPPHLVGPARRRLLAALADAARTRSGARWRASRRPPSSTSSSGVLAVAAVPQASDDPIGALLAVPVGAVAVAILVLDELDEAFANLYSTALSVQNLRPALDRRTIAVGVGVVSTALALATDMTSTRTSCSSSARCSSRCFAVLLVDYFLLRRRGLGRPRRSPRAPRHGHPLAASGSSSTSCSIPGRSPGGRTRGSTRRRRST